MRTLVRIAAIAGIALILVAVCFGRLEAQYEFDADTHNAIPLPNRQDAGLLAPSAGSATGWAGSGDAKDPSTLDNAVVGNLSVRAPMPQPVAKSEFPPAGVPTGIIFNANRTDFLLAAGEPATFIYSTVDGTIAAWNSNVPESNEGETPASHALIVVKTSDGSSFTGLTSARINGATYLYVANYTKDRIDIFDSAFRRVVLQPVRVDRSSKSRPFVDPALPHEYVPFDVQSIGSNNIVVSYALRQSRVPSETDPPRFGYFDIYTSDGRLLLRLRHDNNADISNSVHPSSSDFEVSKNSMRR